MATRMVTLSLPAALFLGSVGFAGAAFADSGPYTKQQADDGHVKFNNHCAQCHKPDLTGALGPSLVDDKFKKMFAGKPVKELRDFVYENMPQTAPKSLKDDQLDPIVAWILSKNGVQPGDQPLTKASAASAQFTAK